MADKQIHTEERAEQGQTQEHGRGHTRDHSRHGHHHHGHHHHHHHHDGADTSIGLAFLLNGTFTIIEFVGGWWTGSVAILSDALHDLGDTGSLALSYFLEKFARKKRDSGYSYGYRRFSLLAALLNGVILLGGSAWVLWEAVPRFWNPSEPHATGMMALALVGILFNGLGALRLRSGRTQNERMLTWHLLEDVFGWVAILIGGAVVYFFRVAWVDPLLAVGFTLFTLYNVLKITRQTARIFLQSVPASLDLGQLETEVRDLPDIHSIHDTHVWSMDGEFNVLTTHVVVEQRTPDERLLPVKRAVRSLLARHNIQHATIEMERPDEQCHLREC